MYALFNPVAIGDRWTPTAAITINRSYTCPVYSLFKRFGQGERREGWGGEGFWGEMGKGKGGGWSKGNAVEWEVEGEGSGGVEGGRGRERERGKREEEAEKERREAKMRRRKAV